MNDTPSPWPSSGRAFVDTGLCPVCFVALHGPTCISCGFFVAAARGADLYAASVRVETALAERQSVITQMWNEQRSAAAPQRDAPIVPVQPVAPIASVQPITPVQPTNPVQPSNPAQPVAPAISRTPPVFPDIGVSPAGPRRSSVQILLLVVGVTLVTVAALFFAVIAFLITSPEVRAILLLSTSLVLAGVAAFLKKRLPGTAESLAALALAFFLIDGLLIRTQTLFGSGELTPAGFTGGYGVISALAFYGFAHLTALKTPRWVAVIMLPFSIFLVIWGSASDLDAPTSWWAASAGTALLVWLAWLHIVRRAGTTGGTFEAGWLRTHALIAVTLSALVAGFVLPDVIAGGTVAFLIVTVIWFALASGERSSPGQFGRQFAAAGGGLSLVAAGAVPALRTDLDTWIPTVATAGAGIAAIVLAVLWRAARGGRWSRRLAVAATAGTSLIGTYAAFLSAVLTISLGARALFGLISGGDITPRDPSLWRNGIGDLSLGSSRDTWILEPAVALGVVTIVVVVVLGLAGRLRTLIWIPFIVIVMIALTIAVGAPTQVGFTLTLIVLTIITTGLSLPKVRVPRSVRIISLVTATTVALELVATSRPSVDLWPAALGVALLALVSLRLSVTRYTDHSRVWRSLSPLFSGLWIVVFLLAAGDAPRRFGLSGEGGTHPALWVSSGAVVFLALSAIFANRISPVERRVVSGVAGSIGVFGLGIVATTYLAGPPDGLQAAPLAALLGAVTVVGVLWQLLPVVRYAGERYAFAAVAPAAGITAVTLVLDAGNDLPLIPALGAAVAGALGMALLRSSDVRGRRARIVWDASLAATTLTLIALGGTWPSPESLVVLGVSAVILASGEGEIVLSAHPRQYLAWLALPLGVAALWTGLATNNVMTIELYTIPVAVLLIAIAALFAWRRPYRAQHTSGRVALVIAAMVVGLAPSVLGSALRDSPSDLLRPGALVLIGVLLAVASGSLPTSYRGLPLRTVSSSGGLFALAGTGLAVGLTSPVLPGLRPGDSTVDRFGVLEPWSISISIVLAIIAGVWAYEKNDHHAARSSLAAALSVGVLAIPVFLATITQRPDIWSLLIAVAALATIGAVAAATARPPYSTLVRWVAAGSSVIIAVVGIISLWAQDRAEMADLLTLAAGAGLLVAGIIDLRHHSRLRSWRALGPGLALVFLPPLLADFGQTTLLRVVLLGVGALIALAAGLKMRSQAPVVIGSIVLIVHGIAQLWPWIAGLYGSVPWWLWAGIGGALLIVIAATYEKRIRDARALARSIRSLR